MLNLLRKQFVHMKKTLLPLLLITVFCASSNAQNLHMELLARGGYMIDSAPHFYADNVTLVVGGTIDEHFSYLWKQRLTRPLTGPQPLNGTDVLSLSYKTGPWTFSAGKQVLDCGGLEYDAPPIDVHFSTESFNHINCYVLGLSAGRKFGALTLNAQVSRSPFAELGDARMNTLMAYSIALHSEYGRLWVPHYSVNLFEVTPGAYSFQFSLGNRFEVTKWLSLECDFMNRSQPGGVNLFKDFSVVGYASVKPFDWMEIMFKAVYDRNNLWDDPLVAKGTDLLKIGTGAYFFPTKDRHSVRLHYYLYNWAGQTCLEMGLTIKPTLLNIDFKK